MSAHLQEGMGKHMKLLHQNHKELKKQQAKEHEEIQLLRKENKELKEELVCPPTRGCGAGTQPRGGMMNVTTMSSCLPGYDDCGTIQIFYYIPPGTQTVTEKHPHPGRTYSGVSCTAYLPDNKEGKEVLRMLKKAFDARLTFIIGTCMTGAEDQVLWNDILHKTSTDGGPLKYVSNKRIKEPHTKLLFL